MGEPHPGLEFDYKAAQAVIDQAKTLIKLTHNQTDARVKKAKAMQAHWKGNYADKFFQDELPRMRSGAAGFVTELNNLVKQMDTAINTAHQFAQQNANWQEQNTPPPVPLGPGEI